MMHRPGTGGGDAGDYPNNGGGGYRQQHPHAQQQQQHYMTRSERARDELADSHIDYENASAVMMDPYSLPARHHPHQQHPPHMHPHHMHHQQQQQHHGAIAEDEEDSLDDTGGGGMGGFAVAGHRVQGPGGSAAQLGFSEHDSRTSFDNWDSADPALLFNILEEALPKATQAETTGRALTQAEQQQKRDLIEHTWDRVRRWLWAHHTADDRQAAAYIRGQADATPLHLACKLHNPPEDIIQALVEAAPDTVSWTDSHGWLPLHHACANGASPEVLNILVQVFPAGKLQQDNQRRTPLHFYATRNSDNPATMAVNAEMLSDSGAAELRESGGMLPMHYACAYGTHPAVLRVLAHVFPESLTEKETHGRTPMHLAMVNAHRDASPSVIAFLLENEGSRATIDSRDNDGYLPLHLLALGLKGYKATEPEKRNNVAECLRMYMDAEPMAEADFLTAIQELPDWLKDTAVVSRHVRNVLNEKIVCRFPTTILMLDGLVMLMIIIAFGRTARNHIDIRYEIENEMELIEEDDTTGSLWCMLMGASYFLFRELIQVVSLISLGSLYSWFVDPTNWLDMTVIILLFYYGVLMLDDEIGGDIQSFRSGVAFTQGVLWVAIIVFLKSTLVDFAVFVGGVFYVVQRLVAFLIAVGVILLAFAQMFYFVYLGSDTCPIDESQAPERDCTDPEDCCRFPHCEFGLSLLKVYTMMMGEIGDHSRYEDSLVAQILYVGYAFLVVILLSNVLIAIVTDSYEIIQNDRAAIVFWSNRLDFVAEMDSIMYAVKNRLTAFLGGNSDDDIMAGNTPGGASGEGHSSPESPAGIGGGSSNAVRLRNEQSVKYFGYVWQQIMLLNDANLYDDIDILETWLYQIVRLLCMMIVIPVWLVLGFVTAGWLWPPQVREYLFAQKETHISRAEIERGKLEQLKEIQMDLKAIKQEMMREMATDREEMVRMKTEVETIQSEVFADLMQIKELMNSLLPDHLE